MALVEWIASGGNTIRFDSKTFLVLVFDAQGQPLEFRQATQAEKDEFAAQYPMHADANSSARTTLLNNMNASALTLYNLTNGRSATYAEVASAYPAAKAALQAYFGFGTTDMDLSIAADKLIAAMQLAVVDVLLTVRTNTLSLQTAQQGLRNDLSTHTHP
jgi:hypothetical protein